MLNSVSIELFDKFGGSSIMAFLRVSGLFARTDHARRPQHRELERQPHDPPGQRAHPIVHLEPGSDEQAGRGAAILATYPDVNVTVRAVVVEGQAPDFIDDLDGNGKYTAQDVQLAGYVLLSNEATIQIHAIQNDVLAEFVPVQVSGRDSSRRPRRRRVHGLLVQHGERALDQAPAPLD